MTSTLTPAAVPPRARVESVLPLWPAARQTVADTELPLSLLEELALKAIHYAGPATLDQLCRRLGLAPHAVEEVIDSLDTAGALEGAPFAARGATVLTHSLQYSLSPRGEQRTAQALANSRYGGAAPVTLGQYAPVVRQQALRRLPPDPMRIAEALEPFALTPELRVALIRAFHSGRPALLYGASGNGKTAVVNAYLQSFADVVLVPAALYVNGQFIRTFDPAMHQRVELPRLQEGVLQRLDRRWIPVRRPLLRAGAELAPADLSLRYEEEGGYYQAPLHLKAQDGVLAVDDLGRGAAPVAALLERWLEPLERGEDLLSLANGDRFTVPFETALLLCTSMPLRTLANESLLRRVPYKVQVTGPGAEELAQIIAQECLRRGVTFDEAGTRALVQAMLQPGRPAPRAVYPADLLSIIEDGARLDGVAPSLSEAAIAEACALYYAAEED